MPAPHQLSNETNGSKVGANSVTHTADSAGKFKLELVLLAAVAALTLLCYSPVLFNFFNGDDFVHLTWLAQAIHHPELVLRNFYTSWLDGTTTKFYRPLISVFMVSDYAVWGVNGLGFRLTNIMFHLSSTVFIFLIGKHLWQTDEWDPLSKDSSTPPSSGNSAWRDTVAWPLAAAALFALYPLHPEAVSWITGRVDSVVTAFCLAAVYFYMKFSQTTRIAFLVSSLVSAALGLLSKEMALTLPAVFVVYELVYKVFPPNGVVDSTLLDRARSAFKRSVPFWILLAVYFVVRRMALGTFVGGYDDSLLFISNPKEFISGWLHGLAMLLVPINKSLYGSHSYVSKVWPICIAVCGLFSLATLLTEPKYRRHFLFLSAWIVLCLLPVYKLFNIADDLQGSRLAYLATVPICLLLTCFLLPSRITAKFRRDAAIMAAALCFLSGFLLYSNNQPWKSAGIENNAIRASLKRLYAQIPGDPPVLFLGLPDQIQGAYTCRNSLDGMTKKPQLDRDIRNCLMVNAFEPIFPFGFLKDSIAQNKDSILIFKWNNAVKSFDKIDIVAADSTPGARSWQNEQLRNCVSVPTQKVEPKIAWQSDGSLEVSNNGAQAAFLEFDLGTHPCFTTDVIELDLQLNQEPPSGGGIDLLYSNDMYPYFELKRRARAYFKSVQKDQRVYFALGGLPEWSLGGKTGKFRLLIQPGSSFVIHEVALPPTSQVIPQINFANSGYFGTKGYIHLSAKHPQEKLQVNVSNIKGATSFALETTRTNLLFEEQNTSMKSRVEKSFEIRKETNGEVLLNIADFKSAGLYEIRIFALADVGTVCGVSSDHVAISVD